jgi:hypothetical protein
MGCVGYVMKDSENEYTKAARKHKHNLQNPLTLFLVNKKWC